MTDAAQVAVDAAASLAQRDGPAVAYGELSRYAGDDARGVVALACASLALALRQPERALTHLDAARKTVADRADIAFTEGRARNNLRDYPRAIDAFGDAVARRPGWLDAHLNLGHVQRAGGRFAEALEQFEIALAMAPDNVRAHAGAAGMYVELGQSAKAQPHFEAACAGQPDDHELWLQSGQNLQSMGRPEKAVDALARAVRLAPQWAAAHTALGSANQSAGRLDAAAAAYRAALELQPAEPAATAALAGVCDLNGDGAAARALLEPLVGAQSPAPIVVLAWANLRQHRSVSDAVLTQLQQALQQPNVPPPVAALLGYRLADGMTQRGDYALAFKHYVASNDARAVVFSQAALASHTKHTIQRVRRGGDATIEEGWQPVFVVGLPRSGTSLVEQVLSGHEQIKAVGEQRALALAAADCGATDSAALDDDTTRGAVAREYRRRIETEVSRGGPQVTPGNDDFCTDKMWQNFEWLWLIRRVFPQAIIVHCRRHPMAVGWSLFENSFGAAPPPFSTRLKDIAAYISHHDAVMAAWRDVGAPRTFELEYETLVQTPEATVRRLLAFLKLDYDPACVAIDSRRRAVTTASFDQVQQPLYTSSIDRWRHFAPFLTPLSDALAGRSSSNPS